MATKKAATPVVNPAGGSKVTPLARTNKGAKPMATAPTARKEKQLPLPVVVQGIDPENGVPWPKSEDPVSVMTLDQVGDMEMQKELVTRITEAYELKLAQKEIELRLSGVKADHKRGREKVMGLMEEIALLQKELGIKTLYVPGENGQVIENTYYRGTNVQLSAAKLLENGVDALIIERSKVSKNYITCMTKLKGEKSDE